MKWFLHGLIALEKKREESFKLELVTKDHIIQVFELCWSAQKGLCA